MDYFEQLKEECNRLSQIAGEYIDTLPFIENEEVIQRIWRWAESQVEIDDDGYFILNGKNELAEDVLDSGVPFSGTPRNGSLHYALGWSAVAQDANLRSLLEFVEGRQPDWIKFQCLAEVS
jgi:hypothetical protein